MCAVGAMPVKLGVCWRCEADVRRVRTAASVLLIDSLAFH